MPQERGFPSNSHKRDHSRSRSRSPPRKRPGASARTNRDRRAPGPDRSRRDERDPSPGRSPSRSPPRQLKRPGGAARISQAEREAARRRQEERERELERERQAAAAARGVGDVVKQHYNAVPERGREWRKTDSKIKGLRSFNNWVKSCIIQKFSPGDETTGESRYGQNILVLDIGCGKGGDLQKWQSAPRRVDLYVGVDPADVSIEQARGRYEQMKRKPHRGRPQHVFHAEFFAKDGYGEWLGDIPIVREVGIDPSVGPDGGGAGRFGGGGFDVVTMMFCMHYAFESEHKARGMLRNVAGSLKKGGRFLGVIPNSDVLSAKVEEFHKRHGKGKSPNGVDADGSHSPAFASDDDWDPEKPSEEPKEEATAPEKEDGEVKDNSVEWGNSIYRVKFPGKTPADGVFRPPFGWKYFYFLEEAVESVPEYVVPWEAFRALAEDYNLELQYRKPFNEVWDEENGDPILGPLSERMGVRGRDRGPLLISDEEMEAASFYHAFCFYKV
ncbi:mRNA capping enzyme-domain-containing protein [Macrophomina phaseolina]|uniref:mRNA cap guanine-N(7) methyltransferase n=1 Tax=Macrophomina phaseolina TaxID=35725 RepID=A0ABQ8GIA0_9PEZI|nr:mRNA capping enzyme-domain-containing protein [Macrophomina phaseolina]